MKRIVEIRNHSDAGVPVLCSDGSQMVLGRGQVLRIRHLDIVNIDEIKDLVTAVYDLSEVGSE
jgi:hypothetical protein